MCSRRPRLFAPKPLSRSHRCEYIDSVIGFTQLLRAPCSRGMTATSPPVGPAAARQRSSTTAIRAKSRRATCSRGPCRSSASQTPRINACGWTCPTRSSPGCEHQARVPRGTSCASARIAGWTSRSGPASRRSQARAPRRSQSRTRPRRNQPRTRPRWSQISSGSTERVMLERGVEGRSRVRLVNFLARSVLKQSC